MVILESFFFLWLKSILCQTSTKDKKASISWLLFLIFDPNLKNQQKNIWKNDDKNVVISCYYIFKAYR